MTYGFICGCQASCCSSSPTEARCSRVHGHHVFPLEMAAERGRAAQNEVESAAEALRQAVLEAFANKVPVAEIARRAQVSRNSGLRLVARGRDALGRARTGCRSATFVSKRSKATSGERRWP